MLHTAVEVSNVTPLILQTLSESHTCIHTSFLVLDNKFLATPSQKL